MSRTPISTRRFPSPASERPTARAPARAPSAGSSCAGSSCAGSLGTGHPSAGRSALLAWAAALSACTASVVPGSEADRPPGLGGDAADDGGSSGAAAETSGAALWADRCQSCHGIFEPGSTLSTGNAAGDFRLDLQAALTRHGDELEAYVDRAMPLQDPTLCTGDCATATGRYLRSLRPPPSAGPIAACEGTGGPAYGERRLTLLTSREYQRSLEDLLGVSTDYGARVAHNDGVLGGFTNMQGRRLTGTLLDIYRKNAERIAESAVAQGRPFACRDAVACGERFVDEFLFSAFRGPPSEAQRAAYLELFSTYPAQAALRLALQAALSSPYFLYRVEAGVELETALSRGYYDPEPAPRDPDPAGSGAGPGPTGGALAPSGAPTETLLAPEFPSYSDGRLEADTWALYENGRIRFAFRYPVTDPAIIEVAARGTPHGSLWPELTVRVGDAVMGVETVDSDQLDRYRFDIHGVNAIEWVQLEFHNDSGVPPWGPGQDVNLFITQVSLYDASAVEALPENPEPEPEPETEPEEAVESLLAEAEPGAWVLTPFELASALSFMLTGSTPDQPLLAAARDGRLATRRQIRAQVDRLLDGARGRARVGEFVVEWFGLDALEDVTRPDVPELTDEVRAAMLTEVKEHFAHVFYDEAVPFSELFDADYTFLDRTLADFYGVSGDFGEAFEKTPVERRGGPLASGAFMTVNAHAERTAPILRAVRAREAALCHHIDAPNSPMAGADIDAQRAAAQMRVAEREQDDLLSSREFYFLYTDGIDACAGCHERIINPMFGMEDFDNVGRLRPLAGSSTVLETLRGRQVPVSIEGTLYGVSSTSDEATIRYAGAKDLSNRIAHTEAVAACLVRRSFRFLTGLTFVDRDLDLAQRESLTAEQRRTYRCVASRMREAFDRNNDSPRALFAQLATDSLLLLRR